MTTPEVQPSTAGEDSFILARGLDASRIVLASQLLEALGADQVMIFSSTDNMANYASRLTDSTTTPESLSYDFRFDRVTSEADYLVREHFNDFQTLHSEFSRTCAALAFNSLIISSVVYRRNWYKEEQFIPRPPKYIELKSRQELDIPPYQRSANHNTGEHHKVKYAIKAGSLIRYAGRLKTLDNKSRTDQFVRHMGKELIKQISTY